MHVAEAARRINAGLVQRHNLAFAPAPAELAAEARRLWHAEIDLDSRRKADASALKMIETRPLELSPEEQVRRKELVADALKRMPVVDGKGPPKTQDDAVQELNELAARPKVELKPSEVLEALIKKQTQAA